METPLATYMQRKGIKDADVALLIGRDRSMVNKIRRGIIRPTLDLAVELDAKTKGGVPVKAWARPAEQAAA